MNSRVMQWLVLCGIPYRGLGSNLTRPSEPASHFPHWAGHTATGRLHCSSTTFQEYHRPLRDASRRQTKENPALYGPIQNTRPSPSWQAGPPVGNRAFCGKHLTASAGPVSKPGPRVFSFPLSLCPCPLGPSFPWPLKEERSLCFNLFFDGCTWTNIIPSCRTGTLLTSSTRTRTFPPITKIS